MSTLTPLSREAPSHMRKDGQKSSSCSIVSTKYISCTDEKLDPGSQIKFRGENQKEEGREGEGGEGR